MYIVSYMVSWLVKCLGTLIDQLFGWLGSQLHG